ncbi:MAG TPA: hypothetical protein VFR48_11555 [Solirubrobacteraceae bacterium]|nr:hypothetical protein [Solirubrobacteraceae bacterium]
MHNARNETQHGGGELFARHDELFGAVHTSWLVRPSGETIVFEVEYYGTHRELEQVAAIFQNRVDTWQPPASATDD